MKILDKIKKKKEYKEALDYFEDIGTTIEFTYNGKDCSVCLIGKECFLGYDGEIIEVYNMEEVRKTKWFNGKCLDEIYAEVDFDYC